MNTIFFANIFDDYPLPDFGPISPVLQERLILIGAVFVVLLILVAWAFFSRHRRRRAARREERRHRRNSFAKNASKGIAEIKQYVKERQRRRKRGYRRNPTLAETGGLPPVRSDDASSSRQIQPH